MLKIKKVTTAIALGTALFIMSGCGTQSAPAAAPTSQPAQQVSEVKVFKGVGTNSVFRVGPGKDKEGGQIYSLTVVTADALFDKDGKVIDVYFDALELLSPNDEEHVGAPIFSGWPTQPGYLKSASNTDANAAKQVSAWRTKRERGDKEYGMNWSEQFANFQKFFKGKTVAEIEQWYAKNTSDVNGRPLTAKATADKDKEKYAKLTDQEKKALADVTSGSTISLNDAHGNYIGALKEAYEKKFEITIPAK